MRFLWIPQERRDNSVPGRSMETPWIPTPFLGDPWDPLDSMGRKAQLHHSWESHEIPLDSTGRKRQLHSWETHEISWNPQERRHNSIPGRWGTPTWTTGADPPGIAHRYLGRAQSPKLLCLWHFGHIPASPGDVCSRKGPDLPGVLHLPGVLQPQGISRNVGCWWITSLESSGLTQLSSWMSAGIWAGSCFASSCSPSKAQPPCSYGVTSGRAMQMCQSPQTSHLARGAWRCAAKSSLNSFFADVWSALGPEPGAGGVGV